MMRPFVNMYRTPWNVVLFMNSSQVTLSADISTGKLKILVIVSRKVQVTVSRKMTANMSVLF